MKFAGGDSDGEGCIVGGEGCLLITAVFAVGYGSGSGGCGG